MSTEYSDFFFTRIGRRLRRFPPVRTHFVKSSYRAKRLGFIWLVAF